jgi:hypothetical protein
MRIGHHLSARRRSASTLCSSDRTGAAARTGTVKVPFDGAHPTWPSAEGWRDVKRDRIDGRVQELGAKALSNRSPRIAS